MIPKSVEEQLLFSTLRLELLSEENKFNVSELDFS